MRGKQLLAPAAIVTTTLLSLWPEAPVEAMPVGITLVQDQVLQAKAIVSGDLFETPFTPDPTDSRVGYFTAEVVGLNWRFAIQVARCQGVGCAEINIYAPEAIDPVYWVAFQGQHITPSMELNYAGQASPGPALGPLPGFVGPPFLLHYDFRLLSAADQNRVRPGWFYWVAPLHYNLTFCGSHGGSAVGRTDCIWPYNINDPSVSFRPPLFADHILAFGLAGSEIPEPSTLLLLVSGLAGLGGLAWRRNRRG